MALPSMTTRRWAVAIGVIALLLIPVRVACDLGQSLDDFYGADGKLALEADLASTIARADEFAGRGYGHTAEPIYRSAAAIWDRLRAIYRRHGWTELPDPTTAIESGLGAALVDQGRDAEAEPHHRAALAGLPAAEADDGTLSVDVLQRSAESLRRLHRGDEAAEQEDRALRVLDRIAAQLRIAGRTAEAIGLENRAIGLRRGRRPDQ